MMFTWGTALFLFVVKWRAARGRARGELNYLGIGIFIPGGCALATNLVYPLLTGRSTYSWIGPYFSLSFVGIVGHAIIRRHVSDLRLIVHRSLSIAIAAVFASIPLILLLWAVWPRLFGHLEPSEVSLVLISICVISVALPLAGQAGAHAVDRYLYRTRADYHRTIREASSALTRVLDVDTLFKLITDTVTSSIESEAVAVYVRDSDESPVMRLRRCEPADMHAPSIAPAWLANSLKLKQDPLIIDDFEKLPIFSTTDIDRQIVERWSVLLPITSHVGAIGFIAVGPKRSGDAFYPADLDVLMTLANQAGTALKNARLYAEVVIANQHIANIVETIESGVIAINASGDIGLFNRAAVELTGASGRVLGQPVSMLDANLSEPLLACISDGQQRTNVGFELVTPTATRPIMYTASPLRELSGTVLGAVGVFTDLTAMRELDTERRRAERFAYLELLAAGIAHEIKNPLVAIKTFTQLLPRRRNDSRFFGDFIRIVGREIRKMEQLLERLTTLGRPDRQSHHAVDVRVALSETLEAMLPTFEEKSIEVITATSDEPCSVIGNDIELQQLFLNLLMNANDATPSGGQVHVNVVRGNGQVTVTISDTGSGMLPGVAERVFDPFFTTKERGSGLGLTICAGIAQSHGARLSVTDRPGGGAVFLVEFPLASESSRIDL
jgi:PAS domain S-box-containing protein